MPKNDFISDNLVHMRDRLKENAAKAAVSGAVPPAVREPEPEKPRLSARQPMRSASGGDDDFLRQKREFEGYLERDRAAAAASLEVETRRLEELQRFAAALEELDRAARPSPPRPGASSKSFALRTIAPPEGLRRFCGKNPAARCRGRPRRRSRSAAVCRSRSRSRRRSSCRR